MGRQERREGCSALGLGIQPHEPPAGGGGHPSRSPPCARSPGVNAPAPRERGRAGRLALIRL